MAGFGESVDPTAAISSILGTYPFSIGLLREILQNSDDAKAIKQVFLLDCRTHATGKLLHEQLGVDQGAALLAYNDAAFLDEDWLALQRIHQSSKRTDTTKIGKYGVGFRSCYHITDTPQILSGNRFAVLDPHHAFSSSGGLSVELKDLCDDAPDHITAFNLESLGLSFSPQTPFDGTIIRLPLRREGSTSKISGKTLQPAEIRTLLLDFVREELGIAMLFLRHISLIEIWEISEEGLRRLGMAEITRQSTDCPAVAYADCLSSRCTVTLHRDAPRAPVSTLVWNILHVSFPEQMCTKILSERLERDVSQDLEKEKLRPIVALAIPLPLDVRRDGRLFTYLPLPLPTGFPCHIHSLFALTPSRQNLANCFERGVVKGTRDELLVEWNRVLFDTLIPKAWGAFLRTLTTQSDGPAIFRAWPPRSQATPGEDPAYWRELLLSLLRTVADEDMDVWPVLTADSRTVATFVPLNATLIASDDDSRSLAALAKAGVTVTQPPTYLLDVMSILGDKSKRLAPTSARSAILADITRVLSLNAEEKQVILSYLLSNRDIKAIADIPVIPLSDGNFAALRALDSCDGIMHTLLRGNETTLFGAYDQEAIHLSNLPPSVQQLFLDTTDRNLNMISLSPDRVKHYLDAVFASFGLGWSTSSKLPMPNAEMPGWLTGFWAWLASWPSRNALFPRLRQLHLLPTFRGQLQSMNGNIFKADGLDASTGELLERLGIPLLSSSFRPAAVAFLEQQGVAKSAYDVVSLLDYLRVQLAGRRDLSPGDVECLRAHVGSCLSRFPSVLSAQHKRQLRSLPIYPILTPSNAALGATTSIGALPDGKIVRCIDHVTRLLNVDTGILLPAVDDIIFVASPRSTNERTLLLHIDHTYMGEMEVAQLSIERLLVQPKRFQQALLSCFAAHCDEISPQLLRSVKTKPFVAVGGRTLRKAPMDIVDPGCEMAILFRATDDRLPRALDPQDRSIVHSLQLLQLFATKLSAEILKERLAHIVHAGDSQLAARLLALLENSDFDFAQLRGGLEQSWLPTKGGLRSPQQCRDKRHNPALFDEVLAVLDAPNIQNLSLRLALEWVEDIPFSVLGRQLQAEMRKGAGPSTCSRLSTILLEFGRRVHEFGLTEIEELRRITSSHPWIPVSSTRLSPSTRAILDPRAVVVGFYHVQLKLLSDDGTAQFLRLMGCLEKPSNEALLEELRNLGGQQPSSEQLENALHLLKSLETSTLDETLRQQMVLPDIDGILRELDGVYYDDLGQRAFRIELPAGRFKLHGLIDENLAMRLGVEFLGSLSLKELDDDDDDEDMSEDLCTRISNVLRQYSIDQAFNEFLANAADAGAHQYNILVDERSARDIDLLSSAMAQFQSCPAIIIHNDAVFKDSDFRGILRVGSGGKQEDTSAIGKFGLGALSVFHFTEVAMIVSGQYVLFLDPTRKYLLPDGRQVKAAQKIPLAHMQRLYADHLHALSGLFDFTPDMKYYNGTLFRLPLRTSSQARSSKLSRDHFSIQSVRKLVEAYREGASDSLLFIQVGAINASSRDSLGRSTPLWSAAQSRKPGVYDGLLAQTVEISTIESNKVLKESWYTVSFQAGVDKIPDKYKELIVKHRIRGVSVALAGLMVPREARKDRQHRLYSKLPLPTLTSLPVHIDAPFVLADDRRSIRNEEGGQANLESQYNSWLLADMVPLLYTFLLETWPGKPGNADLWPGMSSSPAHPISLVCIDAFYQKHLALSDRSFCESLTGIRLRPSEAVFLGTDTMGLHGMLSCLQRSEVVKSPRNIRSRVLASSVRRVDAEFLKSVIDQNSLFISAYDSKAITVKEVNLLIEIISKSSPNLLLGLPVLPLSDRTLGIVRQMPAPKIFAFKLSSASSTSESLSSLFSAKRFLHREVQFELLLNKNINVCLFSGAEAIELVRNVLMPATATSLQPKQQKWVTSFWSHYGLLDITMNAVESFPLVPTIRTGRYVSIGHCRSEVVLAHPFHSRTLADWLCPMLECLGATFVSLEECPQVLRDQLTFLTFTFQDVLRYLTSLGTASIPQLFSSKLRPEDHALFAQYARDEMHSLRTSRPVSVGAKKKKTKTQLVYDVQHRDIARQLPIWEAKRGADVKLLPASDINLKMLPSSFRLANARRYLSSAYFADYHADLELVLDVAPASFDTLVSHLSIPAVLDTDRELSDFKDLLVWLLTTDPNANNSQLKVPDSNGNMVNASTLYARSTLLFNTVFHSQPDRFVHPILQNHEFRLERLGLHHSVDLDSFIECARTVHAEYEASGRVDSEALQTYGFYNGSLWANLTGNRDSWQRLNGLRFIPSANIRRNYRNVPFNPNDYASSHNQLVAQEEVLRAEHEAVAWSQRALFRDAPSEQLLIANLSLGVPSAREIVEHLRVLALRVAFEHPFITEILSDLTKTYEWLQTHASDAGTHLLSYRAEKLFLNVDDPADDWRFSSASQLIFHGPDEGERQSVRTFLVPFRTLLLAAGAKEVKQPARPVLPLSPASEVLVQLRSSLDKQRLSHELTDVVLASSDGDTFHAHRNILAAATEHFRTMFCGEWAESRQVSMSNATEAVPIQTDIPTAVMKLVLTYIYLGTLDENEDQEDLLELLDLSNLWHLPDLFSRVENQLIATITLGTFRDVRARAELLQADTLEQACDQFERENSHAL